MRGYVLRRLLALIPPLLLIYTIVFFLMRATPGGPWDETGTRPVFPKVKANLMKKYHLTDPLWKQYVDYLAGALHGDLGPSYRQRGRTVNEIIGDFFPISLRLGLAPMAGAIGCGVRLGFLAAIRQDTGVYLAVVVTGSFYVESVTGVPGLGRYLVLSISARDYPVIMGTTLLLAIIVMVVNLIVDLSYALLDPRIRYE